MRSPTLWLLGALALLPACSMCGGGPKDPPARYVSKTAEMIVDIPDVGILASRRAQIAGPMEGIVTKEQLDQAILELKRELTFDPTTPEGLAAAGLPAKGAAAVEVVEKGRGALWIVPVGDAKKLEAAIAEVIKSHETVVETAQESAEGASITKHLGQFGPEKALIAAHAIKHGFAFVGVGREGVELVKGALARKLEDSALSNPEYTAQTSAVGDALVRVVVPSAKELGAALGAAFGIPADSLLVQVKSVGWGLTLDEKSAAILLRMRFEDAAQAKVKELLGSGGKLPPGVAAVQSSEAVLTLVAAGNLPALISNAFPPGSPMAAELDEAFAAVKQETGVDVKAQVIDQMSGHAAIALGIVDPKMLGDVRQLLMNPARVLWSTGAVGLKSPDEVQKLSLFGTGEDPMLKDKGLVRTNRSVKDRQVSVLSMSFAPEGVDSMLMETWVGGGAWSFSNAAARTDKLIAAEASPPADKLGGAGGVLAEVQVAPIVAALKAMDLEAMGGAEALIMKAYVGKAIAILERIERVEARAQQLGDGVGAELRVTLAPAPKS